jgi:hypothetical protein
MLSGSEKDAPSSAPPMAQVVISNSAITTAALPDIRAVCNSGKIIDSISAGITGSGYGASKSLQSLTRSPNGPGNHCTFHIIH